ncbi:glycosyltransferase [Winogradskyella bathintestinalis]|uniref:Glycosyltransferase n=1 Tax=Winogradskyella bathintestinalis TaxID=3035208 RepID=A0ABT7ZUD6_9FLAO|nr:glycosyltransferase [Winogradskyella bathintestinalis]MDN3492429.1 glycosyltransferase [Winogradskyella bathintestinalis]
MKTICFVVHSFPSVSETFVVNQIVGAKMQGYSVCILTHTLGAIEQSSQRNLIEKHDLLSNTIVLDYKIPKTKFKQLVTGLIPLIKNFKFWIKPVQVSLKHRILNWPFLLKFYRQLKDIDVFHIQYAMMGTGIAEMTKTGLLKAKVITTFHGHDAHFKNENELKQLQSTYKILFNVSNYVTVNTPYLKTKLMTLGCNGEKLRVIRMAIDVDYFKSDQTKMLPTKSKLKLISVGRLIEFKGFAFAIKAIKLLVDKGMNIHYTIVGEGELYNQIQEQIQALNLNKHVDLVGKKSQDEIKMALQEHHIYLMSSITNAKGRCETQGVVTAEAQAMGLPVVAFNSGGIPYTIVDGETGFLVPEKNVEAYANAIVELLKDSDRYQIMSQQAREFVVKNFSNKRMIDHFVNLYEN